MLLEEVKYVRDHPELCMTLVIDTADWAEQLASNHICSVNHKQSIEDFGYGKGYTKLYEEFGRLLDLLNEVISKGINVVLTAHAKMRKFEQPDELGAYDRWEMKLSKNVAPIVKEWADTVLFVNYKTFVIKDEKTDSRKAQGGRRVMYTNHHLLGCEEQIRAAGRGRFRFQRHRTVYSVFRCICRSGAGR